MNFTFDGDIAEKYGLPEAILFYNIAFWEKQNRLNNHNCFEGRFWTYNTVKAYEGLFYFLSEATIKRALKHLKEEGLILAGNFNNDRFNHTNYYTLSDKGMNIVQICAIRLDQNDPIGEINLNLSILNKISDDTDKNITDKNINSVSPVISRQEALFEKFWEAYPNRRKVNKKGCKAKFLKIKDLDKIFPDIMTALEAQKKSKDWTKDGGQFIPQPMTWINQERWSLKDTRTEREQIVDDIARQHIGDFLL